MRLEVALPVMVPLAAAALSLAFWSSHAMQRWLALLGTGGLLAASLWLMRSVLADGILVMHFGNWQAPFGIVLVADTLSAVMVVLTGITGLATAVYSIATCGIKQERFAYYPLIHLLLAGVAGAFLTGDVFNLYVWFEVMLVASFALLVLGGERAQMEGAVKYVALNLISSALFLSAVGLLYAVTGTLNMADLSLRLAEAPEPRLVTVVAMLFMVAFGIKAAAFPLFFWLPASYHTPPVAVSALFAGMLTKVGVYAMYRMFSLVFTQEVGFTHEILKWAAAATMLTGVLGAAAQYEFRRILSFHIISQIGYMMLGIALFTPLALAGGVFYIVHHIIVKANLFLVSGAVYRLRGSFRLDELGGVWKSSPGLSLLFLVPAMSLAGMPPLSGFFAKFLLVRAGLEAGAPVVVAVALVVGLLTLYSMIKIWNEVFWKQAPEPARPMSPAAAQPAWAIYAPVAGLAALTLAIGFGAQLFLEVAQRAADEMLDPALYVQAVLGSGG